MNEIINEMDSNSNNNILKNDFLNIIELAGSLICEIISYDPNIYADPYFEDKLKKNLNDCIYLQIHNIYDEETININDLIERAINISLSIFYNHISPKRSYDNTHIRIKPNFKKMKIKLDYLKNIPQPEQRTDEWYKFRHGVLTASNIWKVFGTPRMQNEIIYEKCNDIDVSKYNNINTDSPMHWGQKYEPVSIEWYESKYKTKVSDFGCIPHKEHTFIAASPDGINTDEKSDLYGRMVEVKNIVNREINGIPKYEYWIQMQIQMEVCELNECDFLETKFIEYEDFEEFNDDGNYNISAEGKQKGIIMYFLKDDKPCYEYAPLNINEKDFNTWEIEMMNKYDNMSWRKNIYWKLEVISCVLVLRNKLWFSLVLPKFKNIWETIEKEKIEGFEHRKPKRKEKKENKRKKNNIGFDNGISKGICLLDKININKIQSDISNTILTNNETNNIFNITTEPYNNT